MVLVNPRIRHLELISIVGILFIFQNDFAFVLQKDKDLSKNAASKENLTVHLCPLRTSSSVSAVSRTPTTKSFKRKQVLFEKSKVLVGSQYLRTKTGYQVE